MFNPLNRRRSRPRIEKINTQKRDWFLITLCAFFWFIFLFIVLFIDPILIQNIIFVDSYLPFFISLFLSLSLTLSFFLKNPIRSVIYSSALLFLLFLSLKDLGHILNFFLIGSLILAYEVFFGALSSKFPFSGRS